MIYDVYSINSEIIKEVQSETKLRFCLISQQILYLSPLILKAELIWPWKIFTENTRL